MNKLLESFKKLLKNRSLKYGSNSILLVAIVIGIAVVLNILVGIPNLKTDLTVNKLYSVGNVTTKILNGLNKDIEIYGLFDENATTTYKEVVELLKIYTKYPHIKVKYVDLDKNPSFIKEMDPNNLKDIQSNNFIVKCGNKMKILQDSDIFVQEVDQNSYSLQNTGSNAEAAFTGAIKYVTADKTPVVYFIEGHNEFTADSDLKSVKSYLETNNYDVKSINLMTSKSIPSDAEMIVAAAPKSDLTADETDMLLQYLKNGGKGIFMFDPLSNDSGFPEFESIFANYNIGLDSDKVKETDSSKHSPSSDYYILLNGTANNIISQNFSLALNDSRSVRKLNNNKDYVTVTSLASTSDTAVGEQINKANGADIKGPLDIALACENTGFTKTSRIIVMGNASFITDNALSSYSGNWAQFFVQSINWLRNEKDDTSIAPKTYNTATLNISQAQAGVVGLALIFGLPVIILGAGFFVFMRRRHL